MRLEEVAKGADAAAAHCIEDAETGLIGRQGGAVEESGKDGKVACGGGFRAEKGVAG